MDRNEIKAQLLAVLDENEHVLQEIANRLERSVLFRELREFREETSKRFEEMNRRFEEVDRRFEEVNRRFEEVNSRFEDMNRRFEAIQQQMEQRFEAMQEQMDKRFEAVQKQMAQRFEAIQQQMEQRFEAMQEQMDQRFEAMQKQMDKRFEAMQEQMDKRFEAMQEMMNKRFEDVTSRSEAFAREMRHDFETLWTFFHGLGSRWGVETEAAFRRGMREVITKHFGGNVTRWKEFDKEGIVHGHPSIVEIDLAVSDDKHVLIEVAFGVTTGDVSELYRAGEFYWKKTGHKPELAIVTPCIRDEALELAKMLGIQVYSE